MILPAALAAAMGGLYLWRQLHVWPSGKEGWLEEGIVMMFFHSSLLIILLPVIVWSASRAWNRVGPHGRLGLVIAALGLIVATVAVPEMALRKMARIRPNHASDGIRQTADGVPSPPR